MGVTLRRGIQGSGLKCVVSTSTQLCSIQNCSIFSMKSVLSKVLTSACALSAVPKCKVVHIRFNPPLKRPTDRFFYSRYRQSILYLCRILSRLVLWWKRNKHICNFVILVAIKIVLPCASTYGLVPKYSIKISKNIIVHLRNPILLPFYTHVGNT